MRGVIVKQISNDYSVLCDGSVYVCKPRGRFRRDGISPLTGDYVEFDNNYILDILPRKNVLKRPPVANVDKAIIITSVREPDFSSNLLDKLLTVLSIQNIHPVIVFSKLDLCDEDFSSIINYYRGVGYEVYLNTDLDEIKSVFKDSFCVFTGQSGAGKSTLLNKLDPNLNLKTNEISKALNRGKHTTRHTESLPLFGGMVADTPGFSAIDLSVFTSSLIKNSFPEFNVSCKYSDCMHIKEEGCTVKKLVSDGTILQSRYDNYVKFVRECGK